MSGIGGVARPGIVHRLDKETSGCLVVAKNDETHLALSATLAHERVYEAFLGARGDAVQFFHGHSYAGNPIACAAALASLDLFQSEATLQRVASLSSLAARRLDAMRRLPAVRETRQAGLIRR